MNLCQHNKLSETLCSRPIRLQIEVRSIDQATVFSNYPVSHGYAKSPVQCIIIHKLPVIKAI